MTRRGVSAIRKPLTAVVAGATGMIGVQLVKLLLEDPAYGKVVVLTRREAGIPPHPKLDERIVSFGQLSSGFDGADGDVLRGAVVFCTLGTTIKKAGSQGAFRQVDYEYPLELGRLAKTYGASQFLIVTAMGSDPDSRIFYNRVKGEVEQALKGLDLPSLRIFRPSLLLGERKEVRSGERIAAAMAPLLSVVLRGPLGKYKPIAGRAVAKAMIVSAARDAATGTIVYESDRIAVLANTV